MELNGITIFPSIVGNVSRLNACEHKCGSEINVDVINPLWLNLNLWHRVMLVMMN